MKRAVLFFDIDGTLLSEVTKKIPDSAAESVRRAKKAGHMLFINTGRTICSIPAEIRRARWQRQQSYQIRHRRWWILLKCLKAGAGINRAGRNAESDQHRMAWKLSGTY